MKKISEGEARRLVETRRRMTADVQGSFSRNRGESRMFILLVFPRKGKPFGVECSELEFQNLRGEGHQRIGILWQSYAIKKGGEKDFSGTPFPVVTRAASRAARLDAEAE